MLCFVHFDFEMCFAPQRGALFQHLLNFQKWSENAVFCTFWRRNGMRFLDISTSKSGPRPSEFLISKRASRYNGVQFFISHVARWIRTRRFSTSGATNHWENIVLHDFSTFSRACIFFLLTLSLIFFLLCSALLFSDSFHLGFSSAHIVGSLTSKLPLLFFLLNIFFDEGMSSCVTHTCNTFPEVGYP